jgi:hypothetical protein
MIRAARPVLLVWLLLVAISASLLLRAWLTPPKGTAFVGTFFYVDDFFNYLSSVEQAQRGELVFRSKLASPSFPPALVNLEWLAVGRLAALMGGRTILAFRVFGMLALGAWVFATDRFLVQSGLPEDRRLQALLLVFTGGGAGGLLYALATAQGERALDLMTGAFPFVEALANPHFVAGSTLLCGALAAFASGRVRWGAALGSLLAFVRPYDAALLVAIEGASVILLATGWTRLRRLLPLALVLPGLAYTWWVVAASPGFRVFASPVYSEIVPTTLELVIALGPATLLALTAFIPAGQGSLARSHLVRLTLWVVTALLVVTVRPVAYSLQFIVGLGLPLLVLAALGLARIGRGALTVAIPLLATSAATLIWLCTLTTPRTHPPLQAWLVPRALRQVCRPGDLVLAPPEIGRLVGGLTPCWPFVSHPAAPDFVARYLEVARFYGPDSTPAERATLLAMVRPSYVVLPGDLPQGALTLAQPYLLAFEIRGPTGTLAIWRRQPDGAILR